MKGFSSTGTGALSMQYYILGILPIGWNFVPHYFLKIVCFITGIPPPLLFQTTAAFAALF